MALKTKFQDTNFSVGDTIRVHHQFLVGNKPQTQVFQGTVISIKGRGDQKTFTVRKISADAVGVEKIWPLACPSIKKITLKKTGQTRRAKLYFLRNRIGKEALKV